ncbi:uncharacterized protein LOC135484390 isoform X2 [Lineus longissimus]|uniref:uncharacterized protein LOC135484390 isoform X2 n=1 Tax=Lineus longissimus TaxID=88925 RepID=UPI00315D8CD6
MSKMMPSRSRMSYTCTKGLQNAPGENNCFLNCAVQVLWHLDVFRRSFRILSGHACLGHSCIFCALKVIFTQFQFSDQTVLPPDRLRKALAESFVDQQRFQLGIMDDAAECFENILYRIHYHIAHEENEDKCQVPHCIPHQKFSLQVVEQIVCPCGASSEPLPFNQMVLYVSASALASQASGLMEEEGHYCDPSEKFSMLVGRAHTSGDYRECPSACGRKVLIRRNLMNNPDILSLGLIWDSDRPSFDQILDVAETIGTNIRLTDLFNFVKDGDARHTNYQLMGIVCYYGKHYSTFMWHTKSSAWIYFDDATVKVMGRNFQDVIDKCCKGRYQPLLLMYANPDGQAIDPTTAPKATYPVSEKIQPRHSRTSSRDRSLSPDNLLAHPPNPQGGKDQASSDLNAAQRRAVTPTPWETKEQVLAPSRRAVTPSPEWGRYDGDDDDAKRQKKPMVEHHRQGSFLIAISGNLEPTGEIPLDADRSKKQYVGQPGKQVGTNQYGKLKTQRTGMQVQPMETIYAKTRAGDQVDGGYSRMNSNVDQNAPPMQSGQYIPTGYNMNYGGKAGCTPGYGHVDSVQQQQQPPKPQVAVKEKHKPAPLQRKNSNSSHGSSPSRHKRTKSMDSKTSEKDINDAYGYTMSGHGHKRSGKAPDSPKSPTGAWDPKFLTKVAEIQRKESFKKGRGRVGADVIRGYVNPDEVPSPEDGPKDGIVKSSSADNLIVTPTKKVVRAHSVDDNLTSHASSRDATYGRAKSIDGGLHGPQQHGTFMRAKSVEGNLHQYPGNAPAVLQDPPKKALGSRTYDDSFMVHTGTFVENGFASLPRPRRKTANDSHTYVNVDDLPPAKEEPRSTQKMNLLNSQTSVQSGGSDSGKSDQDVGGAYINRKAVENILKMQQGMRGQLAPGLKKQNTKGPLKAQAPLTVINSNQGNKNLQNVPSNVRETLKVDIPDTSSLGSHQDSGYRSNESGTSGDRNSASSASSMSVDSPTVSSSATQQPRNVFLASQGNVYTMSRQPYRQTSQEVKTQSGSGSSKSSTPRDDSPLDNQQKDLVDGNRNDMSTQGLLIRANLNQVPGTNNGINMENLDPSSYEKLGFKSHFDHLLLMAEDLMLKSTEKENKDDMSTALQLCSQATLSLKQAMDIPYIDYQSFMHAQLKHNTCVMRSKGLHRNIVTRQESNHSTQSDISVGDQQSISSMSTDTDSHEGTPSYPQGLKQMTKSQSTGTLPKSSASYQMTHSTSTSGQFSQAGQNTLERQNRNMVQSKTGPRVTAMKPQLNPGGQQMTSFKDPMPQQLLNIQRDSERDSDSSHSSSMSIPKSGSESGVYSVRERKLKRHTGPVKATQPHGMVAGNSNRIMAGNVPRSNSVDNALCTDESGRTYDIYATLPKKGSKREQAMKAEQAKQQKSKNVEVYLDYLSKQKATTMKSSQVMQVSKVDDIDDLPPPPPEMLVGFHQKTDSNVSNNSNASNDSQKNAKNLVYRTLPTKDVTNRQGQGVRHPQPGQQTLEKQRSTQDKRKMPPPPPVRRSSLNPDENSKQNEQGQNASSGQPPVRMNSEGSKFESGAKSNQAQLGRQISAPAPSGYYHYHDPAALGIQTSVASQGRQGPNVNVPNSVSQPQQRTSAHNPIPVMQADGRYSNATSRTLDSRQQSHYAPCGQSLVNHGQGHRQQGQGQYVSQGQGQYVQHPSQSSQRQQLDTRWNVNMHKAVPDLTHCPRCRKNDSWIPETNVCINCDVRGKSKGPKHLPSNGIMKKSKSQSHLNYPDDHGFYDSQYKTAQKTVRFK